MVGVFERGHRHALEEGYSLRYVLHLVKLTVPGHSSMAQDCQPFYVRDEDTWTKIDYTAEAKTWMKPLVRGKTTGLVEVPASWDVRLPKLQSIY